MSLKDTLKTDLDIFLNPDEFGESATFQHGSDIPKTINVLFDDAYFESDAQSGGIATTQPVIHVSDSDAAEMERNDKIEINSTVYYIGQKEPDGSGLTLLTLSEDPWD